MKDELDDLTKELREHYVESERKKFEEKWNVKVGDIVNLTSSKFGCVNLKRVQIVGYRMPFGISSSFNENWVKVQVVPITKNGTPSKMLKSIFISSTKSVEHCK